MRGPFAALREVLLLSFDKLYVKVLYVSLCYQLLPPNGRYDGLFFIITTVLLLFSTTPTKQPVTAVVLWYSYKKNYSPGLPPASCHTTRRWKRTSQTSFLTGLWPACQEKSSPCLPPSLPSPGKPAVNHGFHNRCQYQKPPVLLCTQKQVVLKWSHLPLNLRKTTFICSVKNKVVFSEAQLRLHGAENHLFLIIVKKGWMEFLVELVWLKRKTTFFPAGK